MKFTMHLSNGLRRVNHAAVAIGHHIYSFGGYYTGANFKIAVPMDINVFDIDAGVWIMLPLPEEGTAQYETSPSIRYGHTAVKYAGKAYIWGGRNDANGACNELFEFNPMTLQWTRPVVSGTKPPKRDGHSACVWKNFMYVFGGYLQEELEFDNKFCRLDFDTMQWSQLNTPDDLAPVHRDFHTATVINDQIYVFGGRSDEAAPIHSNREKYDNVMHIYNIINDSWVTSSSDSIRPRGRRSHIAFTVGGYLYIHSGFDGVFGDHFNDVWKYNPGTNRFTEIHMNTTEFSPVARRRGSCVLVDDKAYIFGGTSPGPDYEGETQQPIGLVDCNDLYVLDFSPSLKDLCVMAVKKYFDEHSLELDILPRYLRNLIEQNWSDRCILTEITSVA